MRTPLVMREGFRALSRFSTADSDIQTFPISCEEKVKPVFEPLQGNPAVFRVSTSQDTFPFRKKTPCPTHITIAERILLLRCFWKVGNPPEAKPGNQLSCRVHFWYRELFLFVAETS